MSAELDSYDWIEPTQQAEAAEFAKNQTFWKPQANCVYNIRFGWPWDPANPVIFKLQGAHYGVKDMEGNSSIVDCVDLDSPGSCVVCQYVARLYNAGPRGKGEAKKIGQRTSYAHNVIVREEGNVWRVWRAPATVAKELVKIRKELEQAGKAHFAHPTRGRDIRVEVTGERLDRRYALRHGPHESPVGVDVPPLNLDTVLRTRSVDMAAIGEALEYEYGRLLGGE